MKKLKKCIQSDVIHVKMEWNDPEAIETSLNKRETHPLAPGFIKLWKCYVFWINYVGTWEEANNKSVFTHRAISASTFLSVFESLEH